VKIYLNGASTPAFTTTADANGNWSQTIGHLADGTYSYTATADRRGGHTSVASNALSFTVRHRGAGQATIADSADVNITVRRP